ncbi:MAG: hypothetical protein RLZZ303_243 [Candidatus Hydrogenedentota bacterium]
MSTPLSVVIPTYNHMALLLECLDSILPQCSPGSEVIVVDDGSTEDIAGVLVRDYPGVRVLRLERNRGFAVAVNQGIRSASGARILLLNNDVTLAPGCLDALLSSGAAMVAPLLLWRDDPATIYSAGDRIRRDGRPEAIGFRAPREGFAFEEAPLGVTAACGLFDRRVFEVVGLFEESFVAYFEDADLCLRARLAGFDAAVVPGAVAFHVGSASIQRNTWWRSAQCCRNHALLVMRCFPVAFLWRDAPAILRERRHQRAMMFRAARAHFGMVRALVVSACYLAWLACSVPRALAQRHGIQRRRVLDEAAVALLLSKVE